MTASIYLAPAGHGKTAHVIGEASRAAGQMQAMPRICVASPLQRWAVERRIAAEGGAIGIGVVLFADLYHELLQTVGESGENYALLSEQVQYRLLRTLVSELDLRYYAQLVDRPGFVQVLQQLIAEFKGARIDPDDLARAIDPGDARLRELVSIYAAYQERLQAERWADSAGLGWLAVEALEGTADLDSRWQLLYFDGFDSFTITQCAFLRLLKGRVGSLVITLTGNVNDSERSAHGWFRQTRADLEATLGIDAVALPVSQPRTVTALQHLESGLFRREGQQFEQNGAVVLLEAADRAGEVREALRWLKEQYVETGRPLHQFGLLARDLDPYAPFIAQTAAAFGIPVFAAGGPPLARNPVIAALLDLLRLVLPGANAAGAYALPRAAVVAAWRSPYFDWANAVVVGETEIRIGIEPSDAEVLDEVARRGRVVGGETQWQEALEAERTRVAAGPARVDDEEPLPADRKRADLLPKLNAFLARLSPPRRATYREFVRWMEGLIGDDPGAEGWEVDPPTHSLQVIAGIDGGDETTRQRDREALLALKEVMRGLVAAEATLHEPEPVSFATFFQELAGAIEATFVAPHGDPEGALIVASVPQARGLPFAAVAVLGLGEGSFPATLREDPFLREGDRNKLRRQGLRLESSVRSREQEYFYETVTRAWQKLMLVRARLADDGAVWEPSPYWREVRKRVAVEPEVLGSQDVTRPECAASHAELLQSFVAHDVVPEVFADDDGILRDRWTRLLRAASIFRQRYKPVTSVHDGALAALATSLAEDFGGTYVWSATQIEVYLSCAHRFLCERALRLAPRPSGDFALDAAQLGSIYHTILEQVYSHLPEGKRTDADALIAGLEEVAARVLDAAPASYGFRPAAWWDETKREITQVLAKTLVALTAEAGDYVPSSFEHRFGWQRPLRLERAGEAIQLSGFIDRVDRDDQGRIRIIDYKSGGAQGYNEKSLRDGDHVQLPLYALAAEAALRLGTVSDGFYWHVRDARASPLRLNAANLENVIDVAVEHTWNAVDGIRAGTFGPEPPRGGCPDFCSAAAFCWQFRPRFAP
jgi:ATP-dependent helicase/nuclease subunit B